MTLPVPSLPEAWLCAFSAPQTPRPALRALMATPGFDATVEIDGCTLPWAVLSDLPSPAKLWSELDSRLAPGTVDLILDLLNAGAPAFTPHPTHGYGLIEVAVAHNEPVLLDRLLRLPGAPSAAELDGRTVPLRLAHQSDGTALPWLHACIHLDRLTLFERLHRYGLDSSSNDTSGRTLAFRARTAAALDVALTAGGTPAATAAGQPLALSWIALPPSVQADLLAVLNRHHPDVTGPASWEVAVECLTVLKKEETAAVIAARVTEIPASTWTHKRMLRAERSEQVSWHPLGWVARSLFSSARAHGERSLPLGRLARTLLRVLPEDAWTKESLPGIPDGALFGAVLLAHSQDIEVPGVGQPLSEEASRALARGLGLGRRLKSLNEAPVWEVLVRIDAALAAMDRASVSAVLRRRVWNDVWASTKHTESSPWELIAPLFHRSGLGLNWAVPACRSMAEAETKRSILLAASPEGAVRLWDGVVSVMTAERSARELVLSWFQSDGTLLDDSHKRPYGPAALAVLAKLKGTPLENALGLAATLQIDIPQCTAPHNRPRM